MKQIGTIDLTPSWVAILPVLIELIENSSPEGRRTAVAELNKMARAADAFNDARTGK